MRLCSSALLGFSVLATASIASAHPTIVSGPAATTKTQKVTFGIAHGCDGADTVKFRVEIPAGISAVRPLTSDFGKPVVTKTGTNVTSVTWEKPAGDAQPADVQFYELTLRLRVDAPAFTTVLFPVYQTCKPAVGPEIEVPWTAAPGGEGEPAPALIVAPTHIPGWNKITLDATTTVPAASIATYLGDAQIVWRGNAAFSTNANTMAQVAATPGATVLSGDLLPNDVLWVKY